MNTSQNDVNDLVDEFCDPTKNPLMKELDDYLKKCEETIALHQAFQREFRQAMDALSQEKILKDLKRDKV